MHQLQRPGVEGDSRSMGRSDAGTEYKTFPVVMEGRVYGFGLPECFCQGAFGRGGGGGLTTASINALQESTRASARWVVRDGDGRMASPPWLNMVPWEGERSAANMKEGVRV
jgi:hypothetical protein